MEIPKAVTALMRLSVVFDIKLGLILEEYKWNDLDMQEQKKKLEDSIAKSLTEGLNGVLGKLKAAHCDALGIGEKIRAYHNNYWKSIGEEEGWFRIYPTITAEFNVTCHIVRYGGIH